MIELLILLVAGHYLADFPLQPNFVARWLHKPEGWGLYGINEDQLLHLSVLVLLASVTG